VRSTTNRNFEGRQGRGGTHSSDEPAMAAAAALSGFITDVRKMDPTLSERRTIEGIAHVANQQSGHRSDHAEAVLRRIGQGGARQGIAL